MLLLLRLISFWTVSVRVYNVGELSWKKEAQFLCFLMELGYTAPYGGRAGKENKTRLSCSGFQLRKKKIWILSWRLFIYFTLSRKREDSWSRGQKFTLQPRFLDIDSGISCFFWLCDSLPARGPRVNRRGWVSLIHFVSESGGNSTFLGSRSCKLKPLQAEKGCITPCMSSVVQEVTDNFSVRVLNGNGGGCCPLSWSAAWEEGLNLLKLWREIKPSFPVSAGAICEKWALVAFKRWKYTAQIDNYLQKRIQCFESQRECEHHMFRWFRQLRSIEETSWVTLLCLVSLPG